MIRKRSHTPPDVSVEIHHDARAPGTARRAVAPLLVEDGEFAERVELAASELVTNVVEHTDDGGRFEAWDSDPLVVAVSDTDRRIPTIPERSTIRGGRGLSIVDQVADDWGVEPTDTGKVVWAEFDRPEPGANT